MQNVKINTQFYGVSFSNNIYIYTHSPQHMWNLNSWEVCNKFRDYEIINYTLIIYLIDYYVKFPEESK